MALIKRTAMLQTERHVELFVVGTIEDIVRGVTASCKNRLLVIVLGYLVYCMPAAPRQ